MAQSQISLLHLETADGFISSLSAPVFAQFSRMIRDMLGAVGPRAEGGDGDSGNNELTIRIPLIHPTVLTLDLLEEWMAFHFENPDININMNGMSLEEKIDAMTDWDREFIGGFEFDKLIDILEVAEFFQMEDLITLCSQQMIILIREMDIDQLYNLFGTDNEGTSV